MHTDSGISILKSESYFFLDDSLIFERTENNSWMFGTFWELWKKMNQEINEYTN